MDEPRCTCGDPECPSCGTAQGTYEQDKIRFPITQKDLFEHSSLATFLDFMVGVTALRTAIAELRDAAIRGTDGMDPDVLAARQQLMQVASDLLLNRLELEFNYAITHLESFLA